MGNSEGVGAVDLRTEGHRTPDQELIVGLEPSGDGPAALSDRVTPDGTTTVDVNEVLHAAVVEPPASMSPSAAIDRIASEEGVRYVERNHRVTLDSRGAIRDPERDRNTTERATAAPPDDPLFGSQVAPSVVEAPEAWEQTTGDGDVTIAVIDSGVKYDHEDLAANMDESVDNHGTNLRGDDEDPYPRKFGEGGSSDRSYTESHGTSVAGIAGAVTNNGSGVAGLSDCSLLAVRVFDQDEDRTWASTVSDGIVWAVDHGADVVNLSLGSSNESSLYTDAIRYARAHGTVTVGAAGNDSLRLEEYGPGSQSTFAVSATEPDDEFTDFSNWGPYVDLAAPGTGSSTETTYPASGGEPADEYRRFAGTSMSTPVVSGVAGLALSAASNPWGPLRVYEHLTATAKDVGLDEERQGAGRIDAAAAVDDLPDEESFFELEPSFDNAVDTDDLTVTAYEGQQLPIETTVKNLGDAPGTRDIELFVGDTRRDAVEDLSLAPGEQVTVTLVVDAGLDDRDTELRIRSGSDRELPRLLWVSEFDPELQFQAQTTRSDRITVDYAYPDSALTPFVVRLYAGGEPIGTSEVSGLALENAVIDLDQRLLEETTVRARLHLADGDGTVNPNPIAPDGDPIEATATVTPYVAPYTTDDGRVETQGLRNALEDWRAGELPGAGLADVIDVWGAR